jgi:hypothetical protein
MVFTTKYLSYGKRFRKEFVRIFLIVTAIILFVYFQQWQKEFVTILLIVLGFGLTYGIISIYLAKTFINEVRFLENKLIVVGHDFDSRWEREFDITDSTIQIKSKGRGRGKVDYFLRIISNNKVADINRSFNWDYPTLLLLFHEFKKIKGEKIIFDEKYFLDIMENKSKGISSIDLLFGKESRK